jgi:hypothetical protein
MKNLITPSFSLLVSSFIKSLFPLDLDPGLNDWDESEDNLQLCPDPSFPEENNLLNMIEAFR